MKTRIAIFISALLYSALTLAAGEVLNFTAATSTGDVSVVPDLSWSTVPPALSCDATGPSNWAGAKPVSGSVTLPAITESTDYTLNCTWAADTLATLTWTNPTLNTNGTPYNNPQDLIIKYGPAPATFNNSPPPCSAPITCIVVTPPSSTMRTITGFTGVQTVDFVVMARSTGGVISDPSMKATKSFPGVGVQVGRTITITVNPKPNTPTGVTVQ